MSLVLDSSVVLSDRPMGQADVYRMTNRRAEAADVRTKIGCHTFRATGITEFLRNAGKLGVAQQVANHERAGYGALRSQERSGLTRRG